jgi:hypothetical protein
VSQQLTPTQESAALSLMLMMRQMVSALNDAIAKREKPDFDEDLFAEVQPLLSDKKLPAGEVFVKDSFPYTTLLLWEDGVRAIGLSPIHTDLDKILDETLPIEERLTLMCTLRDFFTNMETRAANYATAGVV